MSITQSKISNTISNTDVTNTCCCWAGIFIKQSSGFGFLLTNTENCSGYSWVWQYYDGELWSDVQVGGSSYEWVSEGAHRLKYTKEGCCDFYSEIYQTYLV